mgnify:CR=1 FL=1
MATKIYISGKISGIENEAPELFAKAEKELQATTNRTNLELKHVKFSNPFANKYYYQSHQSGIETFNLTHYEYTRNPTNRTNLELKPVKNKSNCYLFVSTNRTNLELKPALRNAFAKDAKLPIAPIWN